MYQIQQFSLCCVGQVLWLSSPVFCLKLTSVLIFFQAPSRKPTSHCYFKCMSSMRWCSRRTGGAPRVASGSQRGPSTAVSVALAAQRGLSHSLWGNVTDGRAVPAARGSVVVSFRCPGEASYSIMNGPPSVLGMTASLCPVDEHAGQERSLPVLRLQISVLEEPVFQGRYQHSRLELSKKIQCETHVWFYVF